MSASKSTSSTVWLCWMQASKAQMKMIKNVSCLVELYKHLTTLRHSSYITVIGANSMPQSNTNPDYWMERLNSLMVSIASLPSKMLGTFGLKHEDEN